MAEMLEHRGRGNWLTDQRPEGTIAFRPRSAEKSPLAGFPRGAGLICEGDVTMALVGFLVGGPAAPTELSAILEAYRRRGLEVLKELHGQFVLAIRDGHTIHLARDPQGARSAYYGRYLGRFLFGVEPKSVLAAPGFPRRIRPAAVAEYLTFSFIPGQRTMLEDLFEVPAGHVVSCDGGSEPSVQRYFHFEDVAPEAEAEGNGSPEYWTQRFQDVFSQAVADRLPPTGPIGLFLSGGIDSSIVAAELAEQAGQRLKTYAIHFGQDYPNELEHAKAVADRLGCEHEEFELRPRDFLPRFRQMIWHLDEAIGDPITMPNFELASHVSQQTRWVFNGEGGDPIFGGPKNIPMLLHHWYGGVVRGSGFRERMYLASYRRGYEELSRLLTPQWRQQFCEERDLESLLTPHFECERPANFLDKLTAINIRLKGAHLILPKVERMTGAWGITPLSPLFDGRLIELSFRMPPTMKLSQGIEKVVLKEAYRDRLPQTIIDRPKSGMRVPVHYWFHGELKRYARKILAPKVIRREGIFDPQRVKQLLEYDTEEGPGRFGLRIWMLLTFEIWRRIVVERESV